MTDMNQMIAEPSTSQVIPYDALDADQVLGQLQTSLRGLAALVFTKGAPHSTHQSVPAAAAHLRQTP